LPDGLAEVEMITVVDAELVRIALDRFVRERVSLGDELLVDAERQRHRERFETPSALERRFDVEARPDQHTALRPHQPDATAGVSDILRTNRDFSLDLHLPRAAHGFLE
jgi:hypothetical protein